MKKTVLSISLVGAATALSLGLIGGVLQKNGGIGNLLATEGNSEFATYKKVTLHASDLNDGVGTGTRTVTLNGNPFTIDNSLMYAQSGRIVVAGNATSVFLTNRDEQDNTLTGAHGYSYVGLGMNGLTIDFSTDGNFEWGLAGGPSYHSETHHAYTWSKMIHSRGSGSGFGETTTSYSGVNHQWVGPRDDKGQADGNVLTGTTTDGYVDYWFDTVKLDFISALAFSADSIDLYYLCNPTGTYSNLSLNVAPAAGSAIALKIGGTSMVTASWNFTDGTDAFTWTSSDESVFTVSGGVVTATGLGTATLTLVATQGGLDTYAKQTRTWTVNVTKRTYKIDITNTDDDPYWFGTGSAVASTDTITMTYTVAAKTFTSANHSEGSVYAGSQVDVVSTTSQSKLYPAGVTDKCIRESSASGATLSDTHFQVGSTYVTVFTPRTTDWAWVMTKDGTEIDNGGLNFSTYIGMMMYPFDFTLQLTGVSFATATKDFGVWSYNGGTPIYTSTVTEEA